MPRAPLPVGNTRGFLYMGFFLFFFFNFLEHLILAVSSLEHPTQPPLNFPT